MPVRICVHSWRCRGPLLEPELVGGFNRDDVTIDESPSRIRIAKASEHTALDLLLQWSRAVRGVVSFRHKLLLGGVVQGDYRHSRARSTTMIFRRSAAAGASAGRRPTRSRLLRRPVLPVSLISTKRFRGRPICAGWPEYGWGGEIAERAPRDQ